MYTFKKHKKSALLHERSRKGNYLRKIKIVLETVCFGQFNLQRLHCFYSHTVHIRVGYIHGQSMLSMLWPSIFVIGTSHAKKHYSGHTGTDAPVSSGMKGLIILHCSGIALITGCVGMRTINQ